MTPSLDLNAIAQFSVQRMVDCLVGGLFLSLVAALLLRFARRQNSGTRFAVWFSVLGGIGVLAVFGGAWVSGSGHVPSGALAARSAITIPGSWALYLFLTWISIAAAGLVRVGLGLWHLYDLRKTCTELDPERLNPLLQETIARHAGARSALLCVSDRVQAPTAIGFFQPAVVLPAGLMEELSAAELQPVLLHELAHLRRWDDWTNLLQKIVKALLFFHPVVWWIEPRISLEREMACDDAVLAETANPRAYAQCLVHLAEKNLLKRGVALAQAAVNRIGQTSRRVAQILDVNRPSATRVWKPAVALVAVSSCMSVALLARAPQLVAFTDSSAPRVVAVVPSTNPVAPPPAPTADVIAKARVPEAGHDAQRPGSQALVAEAKPKPFTPRADQPPAAISARLTPQASVPRAVPAKASDVRQAEPVPETFLLFVESRSYAPTGMTEWQIAVWRVTVLRQAASPAAKGISRKSI
ncbi:MAG TPA: M56 family metallopeptidase [Terriglobales bacterium]|jgi:beta-lactamase regulating signal transducer with metallopeptidase domain|nr:M56 family metallopeptidase [Terriglobales bacterium]